MNGAYHVRFTKPATKQLRALPKEVVSKIDAAVVALADNPRPAGIKKLRGREGYRLRVGDYRVLYRVEDVIRIVEVYKVGHRRDVYD